MEVTAQANFALLQTRVEKAKERQKAAVRREQEWAEERKQRKDKKHRETNLECQGRSRWQEKEHQVRVRVAKTEATPIDLGCCQRRFSLSRCHRWQSHRDHYPCDAKQHSLSRHHPQSLPPWRPVLWHCPQKTPSDLDDLGVVDPIKNFRKHFIPDSGETHTMVDAGETMTLTDASGTSAAMTIDDSGEEYDSHAIEAMEEDFLGQPSSQEERHRGVYGGGQLYHVIASPRCLPSDDEAEAELAGITVDADASPSTEARLLGGSPQEESMAVEQPVSKRLPSPVLPGGLSMDGQEPPPTEEPPTI